MFCIFLCFIICAFPPCCIFRVVFFRVIFPLCCVFRVVFFVLYIFCVVLKAFHYLQHPLMLYVSKLFGQTLKKKVSPGVGKLGPMNYFVI